MDKEINLQRGCPRALIPMSTAIFTAYFLIASPSAHSQESIAPNKEYQKKLLVIYATYPECIKGELEKIREDSSTPSNATLQCYYAFRPVTSKDDYNLGKIQESKGHESQWNDSYRLQDSECQSMGMKWSINPSSSRKILYNQKLYENYDHPEEYGPRFFYCKLHYPQYFKYILP